MDEVLSILISAFDALTWELSLALGVAFFASFTTAYAGFGGALFMVPLFTFLVGPIQAIALTAISGAFAYTHLVPISIKNAHWTELGPVAIGLLVSISVGSSFLIEMDPASLRFGMGLFIMAAAALLISKYKYFGPRGPLAGFIAGGLTGGIVGGAGVPAGPILVIFFLTARQAVGVQRANIILSIWLLLVIVLVNLLIRGTVNNETFIKAIFIVPLSVLGSIVGQFAFKKLPLSWFKNVVHWLLVGIGFSLLIV